MFNFFGTIKDLIIISFYLLFMSAFGHEIYNNVKNLAEEAHERGMVNMSTYTRELTK